MRKFTESLNNIKKINPETITYYKLFPLLDGLEVERPGIRNRIWKWVSDVPYDKPESGKVFNINLFFYGVGSEYQLNYLDKYPNELEDSKDRWPEAFEEGSVEYELRLDLNLILHAYQEELGEELDIKVSI